MQGPGGMLVTAGILQQSQGVSADWDLHLELDLGLDMDMDMGWRRGQGPGSMPFMDGIVQWGGAGYGSDPWI